MKNWKDNVYFVLIEPKEPGNIGAAARAIKNMGFKNLELVNPGSLMTDEARCMACHAVDILENAVIHSSFEDAIRDKNFIIGTTRRLGRKRGLIVTLKSGVKKAITAAKKNKVAILFGREDKGLDNAEVEECGFLITIPSDPAFPSLNLAQSVMLVAYELNQKLNAPDTTDMVTRGEMESLYSHIRSVLKLLEYIPRGDKDLETRIMRNLKRMAGRAGLTDWELKMLHGICSQIEKKIKN